MNKADVSIVIPVGNDPRIVKCLDSIDKHSNEANLEVIIVNDGCRDDIIQSVRSFESRFPLTLIDFTSDHIGLLRNLGINKTRSDVCYFVDSDCELYEGAIQEAVRVGSENPVVRGFIDFRGSSRISDLDARLRQQRYAFDLTFAYCPNLTVRKDVFKQIGYFNEEFAYGSDGEFAKRIRDNGVKCVFNPDMKLVHHGPDNDLRVIRTWVRYGEGRQKRLRYSPLREKIRGLFTPVLFDLSEGIGYNLTVAGCLVCRWYGWTKSKFERK